MMNQQDYSLQNPVRRISKENYCFRSNEQLNIDLLDMQSLSKDNENVKYLLVTIIVFSRYASVKPLMNKTAKEVEKK